MNQHNHFEMWEEYLKDKSKEDPTDYYVTTFNDFVEKAIADALAERIADNFALKEQISHARQELGRLGQGQTLVESIREDKEYRRALEARVQDLSAKLWEANERHISQGITINDLLKDNRADKRARDQAHERAVKIAEELETVNASLAAEIERRKQAEETAESEHIWYQTASDAYAAVRDEKNMIEAKLSYERSQREIAEKEAKMWEQRAREAYAQVADLESQLTGEMDYNTEAIAAEMIDEENQFIVKILREVARTNLIPLQDVERLKEILRAGWRPNNSLAMMEHKTVEHWVSEYNRQRDAHVKTLASLDKFKRLLDEEIKYTEKVIPQRLADAQWGEATLAALKMVEKSIQEVK